jgi:hypothetical protein
VPVAHANHAHADTKVVMAETDVTDATDAKEEMVATQDK